MTWPLFDAFLWRTNFDAIFVLSMLVLFMGMEIRAMRRGRGRSL